MGVACNRICVSAEDQLYKPVLRHFGIRHFGIRHSQNHLLNYNPGYKKEEEQLQAQELDLYGKAEMSRIINIIM